MMILGPLVAPSTSTVTPALSRPVAVTVSPSTVITTGSVSVSPTAASVLSISMTSPTATFCCLLPARTIAYTAVSFVGLRKSCPAGPRASAPEGRGRVAGQGGHAGAHRGSMLRGARRTPQNDSGAPLGVRDGNLPPPGKRHTRGPTTRGGPAPQGVPVMTTSTSRLLGAA